MRTLVVSDIFGKTPELERLSNELPDKSIIVDPYKGEAMNFTNDEAAYNYFKTEVGIENYVEILRRAIICNKGPFIVIGFSAGASAIWLISADEFFGKIKAGIGFYSSQIRDYTNVTPRFPVDLVFPEQEPHFDVNKIMKEVSPKYNVTVHKSAYSHGFMNPLSAGFNHEAYQQHLSLLRDFSTR